MFESGPYVTCYQAPTGVRCVKYANLKHCPDTPGIAFAWYAEGSGAQGFYRHFGEAFITSASESADSLAAHAAWIGGNGEQTGPFLRLRFRVARLSSGIPAELEVTGDLTETWSLVPSGIVEDYSPPKRRVERAGPEFTELTVRKRDGAPGFGVRAMLSGGSWIGAGRWRDMTYLHLGTCIGPPDGPGRIGVSDIATVNGFCGFVPWGEISIQADPAQPESIWNVTGAWSESWHLRHTSAGWQPEPEVARLRAPWLPTRRP